MTTDSAIISRDLHSGISLPGTAQNAPAMNPFVTTPMSTNPSDDEKKDSAGSPHRQSWTVYVAVLALAIAIGHVVYAFIRDHVVD